MSAYAAGWRSLTTSSATRQTARKKPSRGPLTRTGARCAGSRSGDRGACPPLRRTACARLGRRAASMAEASPPRTTGRPWRSDSPGQGFSSNPRRRTALASGETAARLRRAGGGCSLLDIGCNPSPEAKPLPAGAAVRDPVRIFAGANAIRAIRAKGMAHTLSDGPGGASGWRNRTGFGPSTSASVTPSCELMRLTVRAVLHPTVVVPGPEATGPERCPRSELRVLRWG